MENTHALGDVCKRIGGEAGHTSSFSFVSRTDTASCINITIDDMLALANSVFLLALSRSGWHVSASPLCAGLIALCCAELCLAVMSCDELC